MRGARGNLARREREGEMKKPSRILSSVFDKRLRKTATLEAEWGKERGGFDIAKIDIVVGAVAGDRVAVSNRRGRRNVPFIARGYRSPSTLAIKMIGPPIIKSPRRLVPARDAFCLGTERKSFRRDSNMRVTNSNHVYASARKGHKSPRKKRASEDTKTGCAGD
ncbi:hypothetical protein KM043_002813 [Ampulex compressa]|nr:hypothetical protein KM043_002813 [Ampulex compressa]